MARANPTPKSNRDRAIDLYHQGWRFRSGRGARRNPREALRLFMEAAELGLAGAQYSAAHMLATGDGVRRNYRQAFRFYALGAAQSDPPSMFNLARRYEFGQGVGRNTTEALKWYTRCAKLGDQDAIRIVADLYFEGAPDLKPDFRMSARWYRIAAAAGDSLALLRLGFMAYEGMGQRRNTATAVAFYRRAARKRQPEAMHNLALCFLAGGGVNRSLPSACRWLAKASQAGHKASQRTLNNLRPRPAIPSKASARAPSRGRIKRVS